ncbi:MAG TPA: hypothetical protein VF026_13080 [Ktedonobacteraceae bacterium]
MKAQPGRPQGIANTYQSKNKPINIRRGEGGWGWMGAAFIAFMVARVLFLWHPPWRNAIASPPNLGRP